MPVNKDALKRYRIIDRILSDPNHDYTTDQILKKVNQECPNVTKRMIQKDIKALEEEFGKEMIRNAGGRGTVKYADQSEPLFYQELTSDEEEVLREVMRSLGQFEGLDNLCNSLNLPMPWHYTSTQLLQVGEVKEVLSKESGKAERRKLKTIVF